MTTPEASKALADEIERDIRTGGIFPLYQGKGALVVAALRSSPGTLFVCPKCGARGVTDGKCSTIEGAKK